MKSQSSLTILLSAVVVFLVLWVYYQFKFTGIETRVVKSFELAKFSKYLDVTKVFSRTSLILSSHNAADDVASKGGLAGTEMARSWICNGPTPPDVKEVRFFLSDETLVLLNRYIESFHMEDVLKVNVTNFTCVDIPVEQGDVEQGKYDERYPVNAYGSEISVSRESEIVSSKNDLSDEIALVRLWYMYRKFKEWTDTYGPTYASRMCSCLEMICPCPRKGIAGSELCKSCPGYKTCVDNTIEWALKQLKGVFNDPDVICTANLYCCYYEHEPCAPAPDYCEFWDAPYCKDCNLVEPRELCVEKISFSDSPEEEYGLVWDDVRGSNKAWFECKDYKYFVSTPLGTKQLDFRVDATTVFHRKGCIACNPCPFVCECRGC